MKTSTVHLETKTKSHDKLVVNKQLYSYCETDQACTTCEKRQVSTMRNWIRKVCQMTIGFMMVVLVCFSCFSISEELERFGKVLIPRSLQMESGIEFLDSANKTSYLKTDNSQLTSLSDHRSDGDLYVLSEKPLFTVPDGVLLDKARKTLHQYCGDSLHNKSLMNFGEKKTALAQVHLLVVFNTPHWKNLRVVDALYRPFFKHITYCSSPENVSQRDMLIEQGFNIVHYIETPTRISGRKKGWMTYTCVEEVEKRAGLVGLNGLLVIHDDQIISVETLSKLDQQQIWRLKLDTVFDLQTYESWQVEKKIRIDDKKKWFYFREYKNNSDWDEESVLEELQNLAQRRKQPYQDCYRQLRSITGGDLRIVGGHTTDIYYIPSQKITAFIKLSRLFQKHFTFVEVAVISIFSCIEDQTSSITLHGRNLWHDMRNSPWLYFYKFTKNKKQSFYHPVKWTKLHKKSKDYGMFLCRNVMPYFHPSISTT